MTETIFNLCRPSHQISSLRRKISRRKVAVVGFGKKQIRELIHLLPMSRPNDRIESTDFQMQSVTVEPHD
jgi:hypothetical protein